MCILPRASSFAGAIALWALVLLVPSQHAVADEGCLYPTARLSESEIEAFKRQPAALLDQFPAGGPALSARVQRLAASDISTAGAFLALAKDAKPAHVVALSIGLGHAVAVCTAKRPDLALRIRELVTLEGTPQLRTLFVTVPAVARLPFGAPEDAAAPSAAGGAAPLPSTGQPGDTAESRSLDEIVKTRPPGFLLPSNFERLPGSSTETSSVTTRRDGYDGPAGAPSAETSGTSPVPPGTSEGAALFAPFGAGNNLFAFSDLDETASSRLAGSELVPSLDAGQRGLTAFAAAQTFPAFGTGGLVETSSDVVSPTHP